MTYISCLCDHHLNWLQSLSYLTNRTSLLCYLVHFIFISVTCNDSCGLQHCFSLFLRDTDAVVRTSYYKFFHPKEALISQGVLNRALIPLIKSIKMTGQEHKTVDPNLTYVYPFGATLNISTSHRASAAVLSSGPFCFPVQRPTCVFVRSRSRAGGRVVVMGSSHVFHDTYIHKEDNFVLMEMIVHFMTNRDFTLNPIDAENPEILDYTPVPDVEHLSEQPISCLQEGEPVPVDFTRLFSKELFELDNRVLVEVHRAFDQMQMDREPLKLIKPQFETPLPPLQPAIFPPNFRVPAKPKLELFDLDDAFSSAQTRLMQIANKCTDADLEYYVKECGMLLGVESAAKMHAKTILFNIFNKIVQYKKVSDDDWSWVWETQRSHVQPSVNSS